MTDRQELSEGDVLTSYTLSKGSKLPEWPQLSIIRRESSKMSGITGAGAASVR